MIVRGRFDVLTFDGHGQVTARYAAGDGTDVLAYETPQDTWHTLVPGGDGGAFVEIKQGPYDPATSAEFAPWAPAEGHASVRRAQPGDVVPAARAPSP